MDPFTDSVQLTLDDSHETSPAEHKYQPPYEKFIQDMRTPLSVMFLNLQLMEHNFFKKEMVKQCLEDIKSNWFQVIKLMNDACDSHRLVEGDMNPDICDYDLTALVTNIAKAAGLLAKRKNLELIFTCRTPVCMVSTDGQIIERIILNLLSDAFRRCNGDGKVFLKTAIEGEFFVITILDRGSFFDRDYLKIVFENRRASTSTGPIPKGLLWVMVVKQLADLINLHITVEALPESTSLAVYIPVVQRGGMSTGNRLQEDFYFDHMVQVELSN